jgi:hypothetical protein
VHKMRQSSQVSIAGRGVCTGWFGCRSCYKLTYKSVRSHDNRVGRPVRNPDALFAALDSKNLTVGTPLRMWLLLGFYNRAGHPGWCNRHSCFWAAE